KVHHEIHGAHESIGGTPTGATGTVRAPPLFAFFVFLCGNSISAFGFSDSFDRRFPVGETPTGATGTVALPISAFCFLLSLFLLCLRDTSCRSIRRPFFAWRAIYVRVWTTDH